MGSPGQLNLDRDDFLAQHWQRKPLLIRNAVDGFSPPLDANELAGLAMEHEVESRIVEYRDGDWHVRHGPFAEESFRRDAPWTLLVQAVDHFVPEVAALRRLIDFLPQWRIDDVMVSYAVDGGSVGPHYDNYDVFLLQGEGQKLWQLGQACDASSTLLSHDELRILDSFEVEQEYLLSPGDILYVPPGIAHCGTARGEATTFSIGFRAPRVRDMVARWVDRLLEELDPELFYSDCERDAVARAGEIPGSDIERARLQLQQALDTAGDDSWFGELVTEPREGSPARDEGHGLDNPQGRHGRIALCSAGKLAWQEEAGGAVQVFANGERGSFDGGVIPYLVHLCGNWHLEGTDLDAVLESEHGRALLDHLLQNGVIHVQR
jgi:50S ribosomal protein L16 3-hydroxylase